MLMMVNQYVQLLTGKFIGIKPRRKSKMENLNEIKGGEIFVPRDLERHDAIKEQWKVIADRFFKKFNLGEPKLIGCGLSGCAYETNNGRVLKLTTDQTEITEANKIKGQKLGHIADVYNTFKIKYNDETFYGLLIEKLREDANLKEDYNDLKKFFQEQYYGKNEVGCIGTLGYMLTDIVSGQIDKDSDTWTDIKDRMKGMKEFKKLELFEQLIEMAGEMEYNVMMIEDIHGENIGYKPNGNVALFDFGGFDEEFTDAEQDVELKEVSGKDIFVPRHSDRMEDLKTPYINKGYKSEEIHIGDIKINNIQDLSGIKVVVGDVKIQNSRIRTFIFDLDEVTGNFFCFNDSLISLKGSPKYVGGIFDCGQNNLNSLEFAPKEVGEFFICTDNAIKFTVDDVKKVSNVRGKIITKFDKLNENTNQELSDIQSGTGITVDDELMNDLPTMVKEASDFKYKIYIFDIDDNLLKMDTKIHMVKDGKLEKLTTAEFATKRNDPSYSPPNGNWDDAFIEFRDENGQSTFLEDLKHAIANNRTAPSFEKFKKALIEGRLFAIVTARGHSPETIRKGVEYFIEAVLTPEEKELMKQNLVEFAKRFGHDVTPDEAFKKYMDSNEYIPVSSPEFLSTVAGAQKGKGAQSPEELKKIAIRRFVERVAGFADRLKGQYKSFSVGFSDDDEKNVKAAVELIEQELAKKYPDVKFRVIDTHDPDIEGGTKIVVSKQ